MKFCKDCKYYSKPFFNPPSFAKCKHPKTGVNLVTGVIIGRDCSTMRYSSACYCTSKAEWFEAKRKVL